MVRSPSRLAVRAIRQAISPRLAMRTEVNIPEALSTAGTGCQRTACPCVAPSGTTDMGAALAGGAASREVCRRGCDDCRGGGAGATRGSAGSAGSAFMMLTAGIEADDGKSYLLDTGTPCPVPT